MGRTARLTYRRVIPCLDFQNGRVVKGVSFVELKDAGDPVEMARVYQQAGADQLAFLSIAANYESKPATIEMIASISADNNIPLIVGGGISSLEDIGEVLDAGAQMITMNSAAIKDIALVSEAEQAFGSSKVVIAIDAVHAAGGRDKWLAAINGGQTITDYDVVDWAEAVARRGAGEILLTSVDADGAMEGYDIALTRAVARRVDIPVIASGGAGTLEHFAEGIIEGEADAVLAASVFHFGLLSIYAVKEYLDAQGVPVRMDD